MNTLLSAVGDWFAQNWFVLLIIVLMIVMLVPSFLRQKKEMNARNELQEQLKKGTRVITTAGVYGVVESVELTTDGKVVTIVTGNSKNPTTMTIHINAIGGIDNKKPVVEDMDGNTVESEPVKVKVENIEAEKEPEVKVEEKVAETKKAPAKKSTSTKKTTSTKKSTSKSTTKKSNKSEE